jgi:hypothetical protein
MFPPSVVKIRDCGTPEALSPLGFDSREWKIIPTFLPWNIMVMQRQYTIILISVSCPEEKKKQTLQASYFFESSAFTLTLEMFSNRPGFSSAGI